MGFREAVRDAMIACWDHKNEKETAMLPKGILFDLDDTIIAYSAGAEPTWQRLCNEYTAKYELCDSSVLFNTIMEINRWFWSDEERHRTGRNDMDNTRRKLMTSVFQKLKLKAPCAWELADAFSEQREEAVYLFQNAVETLEFFRRSNIRLAMMTNGQSHKQRAKINRFGLEKYFTTILVEGEMGFGKPDPAVYYRALDELALHPEDVWSVGDNLEWDVGGPQKLGIFGVWNDHGRVGLPSHSKITPDRIVHTISELMIDKS
ncbi:MAG: HAD family hydrolase [Desulfobacteraceae bacterium]|nr:MAG: HAD family hydrolase [Desulfobacteraceae bacterium]